MLIFYKIVMENSSFYLTCPSNASMIFYPTNKQSSFKINLPKRLYLHGKYEVGLAEISYPVSWLSIPSLSLIQVFYHNRREMIIVKGIKYNSVIEFLSILSQEIHNRNLTIGFSENIINLFLDPLSNKVRYEIVEGVELFVPKPICEILGIEINKVLSGSGEAKYQPDICRQFHSLYVYCNVVDSQIVEDVYAPLLRNVALRGSRGQNITETYDRPHYVPMNTDEISVLEINIKDDTGEDVSFQSGKVICKLHFRQKSL